MRVCIGRGLRYVRVQLQAAQQVRFSDLGACPSISSTRERLLQAALLHSPHYRGVSITANVAAWKGGTSFTSPASELATSKDLRSPKLLDSNVSLALCFLSLLHHNLITSLQLQMNSVSAHFRRSLQLLYPCSIWSTLVAPRRYTSLAADSTHTTDCLLARCGISRKRCNAASFRIFSNARPAERK